MLGVDQVPLLQDATRLALAGGVTAKFALVSASLARTAPHSPGSCGEWRMAWPQWRQRRFPASASASVL